MKALSAYRLVKAKWLDTALSGDGAKRYGGRWNSKGKACLYIAGSESLALLEILVHLDHYPLLQHYRLLRLTLPQEDIIYLKRNHLPTTWREPEAPPETASLGDDWLHAQESPVLAVPSVIVPREWNYVLNPVHPRSQAILATAVPLSFELDERLVSKRRQ